MKKHMQLFDWILLLKKSHFGCQKHFPNEIRKNRLLCVPGHIAAQVKSSRLPLGILFLLSIGIY